MQYAVLKGNSSSSSSGDDIFYSYYESHENMLDNKQNLSLLPNMNECNSAGTTDLDQLNSTILGVSLAVPEWEAFVTVILLSTIIVLTIIGNVLVILSVFTYKPLRIVQNFFIVSLAVADLTVALLVLPFNVAYLILGRWEFGITMCKMWLTCDVMCCTSSILNLCVIALDRYWAITDPINYAHKRTVGRVLLLITGVWLLSLLISSPPLVGWNDWPEEFTSTTPCELNSDRGYVIYSSLGSFFIPLLVMTIVYVEIFIATRRRLRARARASKINTMALRCSTAVIEQSDNFSANDAERNSENWFEFMRCCYNCKRGLPNTNMQTDDVESVSSECRAHNEFQQQQLQAYNKSSLTVNEQELQTDVERLEALERKKARRPRIKDSIKQARKQLPQKRNKTCGKSGLSASTEFNTRKNAEIQGNATKLVNTQVSIDVCIDNDEMTSAFDNDDENVSLKITPPQSSGGVGNSMSVPLQKKPASGGLYQIIEERQRISLSKERRAARTLGIIMGVFVICWLPFSIMYVILPFCESCCPTNKFKNFITWLGYINSGLNPVIYTIFNMDYRRAFKRLLGIK